MPIKKETKTTQKSISLHDLDWAIIAKKSWREVSDSVKLREIIRDWVFLKKLEAAGADVIKNLRVAYAMDAEDFGVQYDKFENPGDETIDELIKAYPEVRNNFEIDTLRKALFDKYLV